MSGRDASRGFLYQSIASVLKALTDERSWDKIYVEFPTENDKVDIALEEKSKIIKCIQVKSTVNSFTKSDILKWMKDLIEDYRNSPEYELFLIGQCDKSANKLIKSIKKYYENALDREAESALEGFDTALLDEKRIDFSILLFNIDTLKRILRDSLHEYLSYNKRMASFEQIDVISSVMVENQMISSTYGQGIDRDQFDNDLEKQILLIARECSPKRIPIAVISFIGGAAEIEKEAECCLSFLDKFELRELKVEYNWNADIYKPLADFLLKNTNSKNAYQLFLNAHTSIAFAAGRILNSKSGISICPVQKTASNGMVLWDVKPEKERDDCNWEIVDKKIMAGRVDCALIINVTHNITDQVIEFIQNRNLPVGRLISCIPKERGASSISIKDGTHAFLLADDLHEVVAKRSIMERQTATMHIFISAPNGFTFFLGQKSAGFGKCVLYEYDFEQRNSCSYSQSISIIS